MPEPEPGGLGSRRAARERALELLYEADAKVISPADLLATLPISPDPYAVELAVGVAEHRGELDELVSRHARNWELHRMPTIDRLLLRTGAYELRHRPEVPTAVILNEAVELAKRFSTEDSSRFVNGVLAALANELRPAEPPPT